MIFYSERSEKYLYSFQVSNGKRAWWHRCVNTMALGFRKMNRMENKR
jgi:hypothetical protein